MTHRYNDMNPGDALYLAARNYPGGIEALAARMGMSAGVLYKKLCTKTDSHHINFEEVSVILGFLIEAGKDDLVSGVINAFCFQHDHVAVALPEADFAEEKLFSQVLEIISSNGVLADALRNALQDDVISEREMGRFEKDFRTCMLGLIRLRNSVQRKFDENK